GGRIGGGLDVVEGVGLPGGEPLDEGGEGDVAFPEHVGLGADGAADRVELAAEPGLEAEESVEAGAGEEVEGVDDVVGRSQAVDPADALEQAARVPRGVVADHAWRVLEVAPLGEDVGRDEEVDALVGGWRGRVVGAWREAFDGGAPAARR